MEQKQNSVLIEECRRGNRKAQMEIYDQYCGMMYSTSLRILNNAAEAEDAMQEAFITAFSRLDDYRGEGSFGGWLRRITVNRAIDMLRKRQDLKELNESADTITDEEPEVPLCTHEEIREAVAGLKDADRVVLSLFLFEGYDHNEIAGILGINHNAVRTRYSRARKRLQNLLLKKINRIV